MPPKNLNELPELCIIYQNGPNGTTKFILGKLTHVSTITETTPLATDYYGDSIFETFKKEADLHIEWGADPEAVYLIVHGELPSNNWRRQHGMSARRKKRKENSSK